MEALNGTLDGSVDLEIPAGRGWRLYMANQRVERGKSIKAFREGRSQELDYRLERNNGGRVTHIGCVFVYREQTTKRFWKGGGFPQHQCLSAQGRGDPS